MWRKSSPHPVLCLNLLLIKEVKNLDEIISFKNPLHHNDYLKDFDVPYSFVALTHLIMS